MNFYEMVARLFRPRARLVYRQTEPDPAPAHCQRPPSGWWCTREPFHGGPCAAYPIGEGPVIEEDA